MVFVQSIKKYGLVFYQKYFNPLQWLQSWSYYFGIFRSSRPEVFCKKGVAKKFGNSQESTCFESLL